MRNYLKTMLVFTLSFTTLTALAQADSIVIQNKTVCRAFYFNKQAPGFYTGSYRNLVTGAEYARPGTEEFGIDINGTEVTGKNCTYLLHDISRTSDQHALNVILNTPVSDIQIALQLFFWHPFRQHNVAKHYKSGDNIRRQYGITKTEAC